MSRNRKPVGETVIARLIVNLTPAEDAALEAARAAGGVSRSAFGRRAVLEALEGQERAKDPDADLRRLP